jgi:hypothetical protein
MWFAAEQKEYKDIIGLKYVVRLCNYGNQGM